MSFTGNNPPDAIAGCSTADDFQEPPINSVLLPVIEGRELSQLVPGYNKVLSGSARKKVALNNLDQLQNDLEKMLSISVIRNRILQTEIEFLTDDDEDQDEDMESSPDEPPFKRMRVDDPLSTSNIENQFRSLSFGTVTKPASKKQTSAKFWSSVEPYCGPAKKSDVAFLEGLIEECSQDINMAIPGCSTDAGTSQPPLPKQGVKRKLDFNSPPLHENFDSNMIGPKIVDGVPICKAGTCPTLNKTKKNEIQKALDTVTDTLSGLAKRNVSHLNQLRVVIDVEAQRSELKKELEKVDKRIIDIHQKIVAAKQKHIASHGEKGCYCKGICTIDGLTRYEEHANQLLRTQSTLIKEIRDLTVPDAPK